MRSFLRRVARYLPRRLKRRAEERLRAAWLHPEKMREFHGPNMATMEKISTWLDADGFQKSVFQYGVPDEIRHLIDLPMGQGLTYTDALLSLTGHLHKPVTYLEIGVSVGKNFLQMAESLSRATLTGFDIEEISPVLKNHFQPGSRTEWPTTSSSLKKANSSLSKFATTVRDNQVSYLSGDVFDEQSWRHLKGQKFNVVFSDAFHSAEALKVEHEMLLRHDLLDHDEVIIMWDDLGGGMTDAFEEIAVSLRKSRKGGAGSSFVVPLKGWLGDNWGDHQVGFFISI